MNEVCDKILELTNEYFFEKVEEYIEYKIKKSCIKEQQFIYDIKNNFYQKIIYDINVYKENRYDMNELCNIIENPFWNVKKWDDIKNSIHKVKEEERLLATTDRFMCSKCKGNKCVYNEKQTRSADEPTTKYVTCVLCGHKWTFC